MNALSPSEPRRSNVALIVSICINLVLAGIIAMAMARFVWHGPFMPMGGQMAQEHVQVRQILAPRMLIRIVPEKTDAIRDLARAHRERVENLRREANDARRDLLRIYGAPVFDKPAFEKALVRMQTVDSALETEALTLAAETASVLSPEQRKRVAEWHGRGFGGGFGGAMGWQGRGRGQMHDAPPPDGGNRP